MDEANDSVALRQRRELGRDDHSPWVQRGTTSLRWTLALGLLASCRAGDEGPGFTGEPPEPPETTGTNATIGTTGTIDDTGNDDESLEIPCGLDTPCPSGTHCVGRHQAGTLDPPESFVCRSECVAVGSVADWCFDDTSCCGESFCDAQFGVCQLEPAMTTGTDATAGPSDESTSTGDTSTSTGDESTSTGDTTSTADTTRGDDEGTTGPGSSATDTTAAD